MTRIATMFCAFVAVFCIMKSSDTLVNSAALFPDSDLVTAEHERENHQDERQAVKKPSDDDNDDDNKTDDDDDDEDDDADDFTKCDTYDSDSSEKKNNEEEKNDDDDDNDDNDDDDDDDRKKPSKEPRSSRKTGRPCRPTTKSTTAKPAEHTEITGMEKGEVFTGNQEPNRTPDPQEQTNSSPSEQSEVTWNPERPGTQVPVETTGKVFVGTRDVETSGPAGTRSPEEEDTGTGTSPGETPKLTVTPATPQNTEVPSVEVPSAEVPSVEVPSVEVPTVEVPTVEVPTVEVPSVEVPTVEIPSTEVPSTEESTAEVPTVEVPSAEVPSTEEPTVEVPTVEVPSADEPSTKVPSVEIPSVEVPSTEVPSAEVNVTGTSVKPEIELPYDHTEGPATMETENHSAITGISEGHVEISVPSENTGTPSTETRFTGMSQNNRTSEKEIIITAAATASPSSLEVTGTSSTETKDPKVTDGIQSKVPEVTATRELTEPITSDSERSGVTETSEATTTTVTSENSVEPYTRARIVGTSELAEVTRVKERTDGSPHPEKEENGVTASSEQGQSAASELPAKGTGDPGVTGELRSRQTPPTLPENTGISLEAQITEASKNTEVPPTREEEVSSDKPRILINATQEQVKVSTVTPEEERKQPPESTRDLAGHFGTRTPFPLDNTGTPSGEPRKPEIPEHERTLGPVEESETHSPQSTYDPKLENVTSTEAPLVNTSVPVISNGNYN